MGMYTEIYVNVDLVPNVPEKVIKVLQAMCGDREPDILLEDVQKDWLYLFNNGSFYVPSTVCRNLTYNNISNRWSLLGKGDLKNYNGQIESFFAWLMPYIKGHEGDFIGYSRYEESQEPTLFYLKNHNEPSK